MELMSRSVISEPSGFTIFREMESKRRHWRFMNSADTCIFTSPFFPPPFFLLEGSAFMPCIFATVR